MVLLRPFAATGFHAMALLPMQSSSLRSSYADINKDYVSPSESFDWLILSTATNIWVLIALDILEISVNFFG